MDNTAEATATGNLFSDTAGKVSVLAKSTRNATIGFVVLGFAVYWAAKGQATAVGNKASFLWRKFPKFVLGFLAISLLATVNVFDKAQVASLGNLSKWAFLLTFAGVGLNIDLRHIRAKGWRPFAVAVRTILSASSPGSTISAFGASFWRTMKQFSCTGPTVNIRTSSALTCGSGVPTAGCAAGAGCT